MKRRVLIAVILVSVFLLGTAVGWSGGTRELRLANNEEGIVYCEGSRLNYEAIDDLTVYHHCYTEGEPPAGLYLPLATR